MFRLLLRCPDNIPEEIPEPVRRDAIAKEDFGSYPKLTTDFSARNIVQVALPVRGEHRQAHVVRWKGAVRVVGVMRLMSSQQIMKLVVREVVTPRMEDVFGIGAVERELESFRIERVVGGIGCMPMIIAKDDARAFLALRPDRRNAEESVQCFAKMDEVDDPQEVRCLAKPVWVPTVDVTLAVLFEAILRKIVGGEKQCDLRVIADVEAKRSPAVMLENRREIAHGSAPSDRLLDLLDLVEDAQRLSAHIDPPISDRHLAFEIVEKVDDEVVEDEAMAGALSRRDPV